MGNNNELLDLNALLQDRMNVTELSHISGIAKRAIAGLQVLADRAEIRLSAEIFSKIGSAAPSQSANHGAALRISGETGIGRWGRRHVEFRGVLPVYKTAGGYPSFKNYTEGDVPFELTFTVTSDSGDSSTFVVRHGHTAWDGYDDEFGNTIIKNDGEEFELPNPVDDLIRDVVQRLCERVLSELLEIAQVAHQKEEEVYVYGQGRLDNFPFIAPMVKAGLI